MDLLNSFLDKLKLESTKKLELSKKYQVLYFENGQLCKVTPEETEYTYNARFINSDGKLYDLHDINDIDKLPIPSFLRYDIFNGYGITGSLDYFLKMKASLLRTNGLVNESDHLYRRLYLFMAASNNWFLEEDYLCYCKVLLQELRLEEAESEELKIKSYLKQHGIVKDLSLEIANLTIKNCKKYNTDLVQMSAHCSCCEICNKLQGRVYSLSGNSKIFPKLPEVILKTGKVHDGCRHTIAPFFIKYSDTIADKFGNDVDVIQASTRPYVDDRTEEEKRNYILYTEDKKKRDTQMRDRKEYYRIVYALPDDAPKSFSAYRRMKRTKTKNFLLLMEKAKEVGIEIILDD